VNRARVYQPPYARPPDLPLAHVMRAFSAVPSVQRYVASHPGGSTAVITAAAGRDPPTRRAPQTVGRPSNQWRRPAAAVGSENSGAVTSRMWVTRKAIETRAYSASALAVSLSPGGDRLVNSLSPRIL
jgi:hypothetical protein